LRPKSIGQYNPVYLARFKVLLLKQRGRCLLEVTAIVATKIRYFNKGHRRARRALRYTPIRVIAAVVGQLDYGWLTHGQGEQTGHQQHAADNDDAYD
jgi:hypothetical protein